MLPIGPGDRIRIGGTGPFYDVLNVANNPADAAFQPYNTPADVSYDLAMIVQIDPRPRPPALYRPQPQNPTQYVLPFDPSIAATKAERELLKSKLLRPFQIQRSWGTVGNPNPLAATPTQTFPQGVAVDLTFSGVGVATNLIPGPTLLDQVQATAAWKLFHTRGLSTPTEIAIVFAPSGQVSQVIRDGIAERVIEDIYLLVGRTEQVLPLDGLAHVEPEEGSGEETSNLMDPQALWLTIGATTGKTQTTENQPPIELSDEFKDALGWDHDQLLDFTNAQHLMFDDSSTAPHEFSLMVRYARRFAQDSQGTGG